MAEPQLSDVPEAASQAAPPLGIQHLLLWTACSAVLLTATLALNRAIEERLQVSYTEQKFFGSVRALVDGPAVAALLVWLVRKQRGARFPVQPGEWLLVLSGVRALLVLAGIAAWCRLPLGRVSEIFLLLSGLMAAAYLFVAIWPPLPRWWRCAFIAYASVWAIECAEHLLLFDFFANLPASLHELIGLLYIVDIIASIVLIIVCSEIDRARQVQRGWMHWTGVASCIATFLVTIGQHLYYHWFALSNLAS